MKARHHRVIVHKRGAPDVLQLVAENAPEPGLGEVRLKMEAAGVSAYDVMLRSKWFPGFTRVPFTPGVDVVGVVDKLGDGVTSLQPGQRVAGLMGFDGGGYAEVLCCPEDELASVPDGVDPAEAVCLVANYLTAHAALHTWARVQSRDRVLIHGAAGGVGTALLELGGLAGLEMFGTASKHNHELVSSLGATPIDYRADDFVERIRTLTGDGVDVVFDPIGGARQLRRSYRTLRKGGRLVWFGVASSSRQGVKVIPLSLLARTMLALIPDGKRVSSTALVATEEQIETLSHLLDMLAAGKIKPIVAAQIPLAEASRAHEVLERGGVAGKVVLVP